MFGIGEIAKAGDKIHERLEKRKLKKIELADKRHERELNASSKAIERAATANGIKGLWRPILMLTLTAIVAWWSVQTFIMFGILLWEHVFGPGEALNTGIRELIGDWVAIGFYIFTVLGAFGGVTSWSRGKEKIAGQEDSDVGSLDKIRDVISRDAPEPVIVRKEMDDAPETVQKLDGIVVPGREAAAKPVSFVSQPDAIDMDVLAAEIKDEEGFRDHIYNDSLGKPTFGYGSLVQPADPEYGLPVGTKISPERIDAAFKIDMQNAIRDARTVVRSFDDLSQDIKHALVSMAFQLGGAGLSKFKNMLKAIELRDGEAARRHALDSRWAQQTPARANRMANRLAALSAESGHVQLA